MTCETHAHQPMIGEARPEFGRELRIFPVGSYVVIYRPITGGIRVLRVLLGRRNYQAFFRGRQV
jgi:toxin ParE1/3/4